MRDAYVSSSVKGSFVSSFAVTIGTRPTKMGEVTNFFTTFTLVDILHFSNAHIMIVVNTIRYIAQNIK